MAEHHGSRQQTRWQEQLRVHQTTNRKLREQTWNGRRPWDLQVHPSNPLPPARSPHRGPYIQMSKNMGVYWGLGGLPSFSNVCEMYLFLQDGVMRMWGEINVCVHVCVEAKGWLMMGVFLSHSPPYILRRCLSLNLALTVPARLAGQRVSGYAYLCPELRQT